jgi:hypothetical protein
LTNLRSFITTFRMQDDFPHNCIGTMSETSVIIPRTSYFAQGIVRIEARWFNRKLRIAKK